MQLFALGTIHCTKQFPLETRLFSIYHVVCSTLEIPLVEEAEQQPVNGRHWNDDLFFVAVLCLLRSVGGMGLGMQAKPTFWMHTSYVFAISISLIPRVYPPPPPVDPGLIIFCPFLSLALYSGLLGVGVILC